LSPGQLAVGADGSLFAVYTAVHEVRLIRPDGSTELVAEPSQVLTPPEVPTVLQNRPPTLPWGLAVAPDGTVFVGDIGGRVRRIAPAGAAATYVGGPVLLRDGEPALNRRP